MKKLIFTVFAFFTAVAVMGQNHIATLDDRERYGAYIEPGDVIIDTPTKITNGERDVIYYFMGRQWPGLREGGTIWLDGDKLGKLNLIKFCNTSNPLMRWHVESAKIKNIPNTQVIAKAFVCQGLKRFELDGESAWFPGLTKWPDDRRFLTGAFGFHVIGNSSGGHCYSITVRDGGTIRLNGFEAQHAFSGLRINGGDYDITVESLEISNFYIHDTGTGEGQYLGGTHKPPLAKLKNLRIHHGIITRTAAEAVQVQHLVGGADIHHITVFAADVRWLNEFGPGQDTGIQWSVDAGENSFHHIIVDGFASVGMIPFGSDQRPVGGVSRVTDVLFNDGRDMGIYLHKSERFGVHWIFRNIYFRGFTSLYHEETGRRKTLYYVSRKYGTDRVTFDNIFHDGSKTKVFDDTTGLEIGTVVRKKMPPPAYRNSGFHEPAHRIQQWHPYYAAYFPVSRRDTVTLQVPVLWEAGDIAIETVGQYGFYKCIKTHHADEVRPEKNPCFVRLTWDANGVRSDQASWDAHSRQSDFPPDDFRLRKDNYWKKLGIGFQEELADRSLSSN